MCLVHRGDYSFTIFFASQFHYKGLTHCCRERRSRGAAELELSQRRCVSISLLVFYWDCFGNGWTGQDGETKVSFHHREHTEQISKQQWRQTVMWNKWCWTKGEGSESCWRPDRDCSSWLPVLLLCSACGAAGDPEQGVRWAWLCRQVVLQCSTTQI